MALDPVKLNALMILVCAVALVILLALIIYTWVKWHQRQLNPRASNEPAPHGIELTAVKPAAHFQKGYLNEVGRENPNLSGSCTFLNKDVLKHKPFPKDGSAPPDFQSKDVVYHANAERNPKDLYMFAGDVVNHINGPYYRGHNNKTTNEVDVGHVSFNVEDPSGKRNDGLNRWPERGTATNPWFLIVVELLLYTSCAVACVTRPYDLESKWKLKYKIPNY